jgi:hypothetical protein
MPVNIEACPGTVHCAGDRALVKLSASFANAVVGDVSRSYPYVDR